MGFISDEGDVNFNAVYDTESEDDFALNFGVNAEGRMGAAENSGNLGVSGEHSKLTMNSSAAKVSNIKSGGNFTLKAGNDLRLEGTNIDVAGDGTIHAENNIDILAVTDTFVQDSSESKSDINVGKDPKEKGTYLDANVSFGVGHDKTETSRSAHIKIGGDASVTAGNDVNWQVAEGERPATDGSEVTINDVKAGGKITETSIADVDESTHSGIDMSSGTKVGRNNSGNDVPKTDRDIHNQVKNIGKKIFSPGGQDKKTKNLTEPVKPTFSSTMAQNKGFNRPQPLNTKPGQVPAESTAESSAPQTMHSDARPTPSVAELPQQASTEVTLPTVSEVTLPNAPTVNLPDISLSDSNLDNNVDIVSLPDTPELPTDALARTDINVANISSPDISLPDNNMNSDVDGVKLLNAPELVDTANFNSTPKPAKSDIALPDKAGPPANGKTAVTTKTAAVTAEATQTAETTSATAESDSVERIPQYTAEEESRDSAFASLQGDKYRDRPLPGQPDDSNLLDGDTIAEYTAEQEQSEIAQREGRSDNKDDELISPLDDDSPVRLVMEDNDAGSWTDSDWTSNDSGVAELDPYNELGQNKSASDNQRNTYLGAVDSDGTAEGAYNLAEQAKEADDDRPQREAQEDAPEHDYFVLEKPLDVQQEDEDASPYNP